MDFHTSPIKVYWTFAISKAQGKEGYILSLVKSDSFLKGRRSRICQFQFVNTTFKVGTSFPALFGCVLKIWHLVAMFLLNPELLAVTGWGLHTHRPGVNAQKHPKCKKKRQKKKIRADSRVSADTDIAQTSDLKMMIEGNYFCLGPHIVLFRKIQIILPLIKVHHH